MKEKRIEMIKMMMDSVKKIQESYIQGSSGWALLQAAWSPLMVMHHIEAETIFDDKIIGAIAQDE